MDALLALKRAANRLERAKASLDRHPDDLHLRVLEDADAAFLKAQRAYSIEWDRGHGYCT